jgi:hypothetical protein
LAASERASARPGPGEAAIRLAVEASLRFGFCQKAATMLGKGKMTMGRLIASQFPDQNVEALTRFAALLDNLATKRRGLLLSPFIAALPASLVSAPAYAVDPNETQVTLPDQFQWKAAFPGVPPQSAETAPVFGSTDKPGPYAVLVKWYPGYMSAPHKYVTDRLSFVMSGTWWVNSGENFEPRPQCRSRPAASFAASRTRRTTTE